MGEIEPDAFEGLPSEEAGYLSPEQYAALSSAQLEKVDSTGLTADHLKELAKEDGGLSKLSASKYKAAPADAFSGLDATAIRELDTEGILDELEAPQLQAISAINDGEALLKANGAAEGHCDGWDMEMPADAFVLKKTTTPPASSPYDVQCDTDMGLGDKCELSCKKASSEKNCRAVQECVEWREGFFKLEGSWPRCDSKGTVDCATIGAGEGGDADNSTLLFILIILGVAALCCCILIIAALMFRNKNNNKDKEIPDETEEEMLEEESDEDESASDGASDDE